MTTFHYDLGEFCRTDKWYLVDHSNEVGGVTISGNAFPISQDNRMQIYAVDVVISQSPAPQPQVVKLTLSRTVNIPNATHSGALYIASGKVKSVKNLEQFGWWLNHEDTQNPPLLG